MCIPDATLDLANGTRVLQMRASLECLQQPGNGCQLPPRVAHMLGADTAWIKHQHGLYPVD